jgi:GNAT superfamily N-acetyltransferase
VSEDLKPVSVRPSTAEAVLPLRVRHRQEMNCQIVHDSIHQRDGWTATYILDVLDVTAGFGSIAIAGPWKNKPTIFEFYVLPGHRVRGFELFEALLAASGARFMEVQSNDELLTVMLHTYAQNISSEKIVFRDGTTTGLPAQGTTLQRLTSDQEIWDAIAERHGGAEYQLVLEGTTVATGGLMFHYNVPYADIYMETREAFRRRGFGSYLVQELKREAYELGSIPCARCNPENIASRQSLQKAGLIPFAHILNGSIGESAG